MSRKSWRHSEPVTRFFCVFWRLWRSWGRWRPGSRATLQIVVGESASVGQSRGHIESGSRRGRIARGCWLSGGGGRFRLARSPRSRRRRRSGPSSSCRRCRWYSRSCPIDWGWRGRRRRVLCLGLLLLQELDNEILVLLDKVIGEAFRPQIVAKVFSPVGVESLQDGELRWHPATGSIETTRMRPTELCRCRARRIGGRGCGRLPMSSEDATEQAVFVAATCCAWRYAAEGGVSGCFAGILFPVVHLLLELLGLFLVDESEPGQAVLQLEAVKEGAVLVVAPRIEYLLVPYDSSHRRLLGGRG